MSPEEKAVDLLVKFRPLTEMAAHKKRTEAAKQAALICVDEIINSHQWSNYWDQVKEEIIRL